MKDIISLIKPPELNGNFLDDVKSKIVTRVKECNLDKGDMKFEPRVVLYVATIIETIIAKEQKINKRDLLLEIWKELYGLSKDDETQIKAIVDMLHLAKRIKKKSYYKLFLVSISESMSFCFFRK